jgi:hypothetical protein
MSRQIYTFYFVIPKDVQRIFQFLELCFFIALQKVGIL